MMFSYPYFNLPYYNRYSRYGYRYPNNYSFFNKTSTKNKPEPHIKKELDNTLHMNQNKNKYQDKCQNYNNANNLNDSKKEETSCFEDSPLFQIFGINLYFDDILLICLIFFLYQEGVKDESLFIALILLLLS